MMFREGKVVEKKLIGGKEVVFRFPQQADAKGCMAYINSLVRERARILVVREVTLAQERAWLKGEMEDIRKGRALVLFVEIGGRIAGVIEMKRRAIPPSAIDHTADIGFGILKQFRRKGITEHGARLLMGLARGAWKITQVRSCYLADNTASARLHARLGFRKVGRVPRGGKYRKKYVDEIIVVKEL